uniref:Ribosomal protein S10 n=1 Tax=Navicula ramosissima TaxID=265559 RepID=A0A343A6X6_9STRA|nr:ribosomal protein S10 [Navicula ramosissima]AOY40414.1 ribosomal protein S10 [Navicula ramosissima]
MINYKLIKLYSKDKKSLKQFEEFLKKLNKKWKNINVNIKAKKRKKQRITLLKSPHVNKKAQTHFQSIIYSADIKMFTVKC